MIRLQQGLAAASGVRGLALALALGAVAALALPPLGLWPVLFVAVPLFLAMLEATAKARSALVLGWAYGWGYFIVAFHWIGYAFLVDAKTYLWMMPFAVGGLSAAMAVYWGLAAAAVRLMRLRGIGAVLGFAAWLAAMEWLRGHLFTGFPWAAPGLAVDGMGGLAQLAAIVGMTGLTLLLTLWSGLGAILVWPAPGRHRIIAGVLLMLLPAAWSYGWLRGNAAGNDVVPGVTLRIVQPALAQDEKWREDNSRAIFDTLKELSSAPTKMRPRGIAEVSHVIWPESAVPFFIDESPVAKAELAPLLGGRTVLITGALRRDPPAGDGAETAVHNSIITFDGNAYPVARYDKWRLVPGGEFLPLAWLLEPLGFRRVVTVPGNFEPGRGPITIAVPNAPGAAMLVCYEAIFPHDLIDPLHRPGFIVNVTNDGWFGTSTGPYQHLAQVRLRAIEQGLPVVRAANTGISAIIDSYGRIRGKLDLMTHGVVDGDLPQAIAPPPYARFGDAMLAALAAMTLGLAALLNGSAVSLKPKSTRNR